MMCTWHLGMSPDTRSREEGRASTKNWFRWTLLSANFACCSFSLTWDLAVVGVQEQVPEDSSEPLWIKVPSLPWLVRLWLCGVWSVASMSPLISVPTVTFCPAIFPTKKGHVIHVASEVSAWFVISQSVNALVCCVTSTIGLARWNGQLFVWLSGSALASCFSMLSCLVACYLMHMWHYARTQYFQLSLSLCHLLFLPMLCVKLHLLYYTGTYVRTWIQDLHLQCPAVWSKWEIVIAGEHL